MPTDDQRDSKIASLTHLPLDQMTAISQTIFSNALSWLISSISSLKIHWILFINPVLVQIMAWSLIIDKPLSEPMLTRFTDAYMQH